MITNSLPSPTEAVVLAERSAHALCASVHGLEETELDRPTPCTEWDLRALLLHLADSADSLAALTTTGQQVMPSPPRSSAPDPAALVGERVQLLVDALSSADDDHRAWVSSAAYGAAIELAAHAWDIAISRGAPTPLTDDHAEAVLVLAEQLITDDARAPQFGRRIEPAADVGPSNRLAAFVGRPLPTS